MNVKIDSHMHTIVSGHAYNTINEMIDFANKKGMEVICITEHAPAMPGSAHDFYFSNMHILKNKPTPIPVLFGAEANILNSEGYIDLDEFELKQQDIVIASLHNPCFNPHIEKTIENCTEAYLAVMNNPYVTIIGHPDDSLFPINYDKFVRKAVETHTIIELNNSSNNPNGFRKGAKERDIEYLNLCKKYGAYISLGSDAHSDHEIGNFDFIMPILKEVNFPEKLIINSSKKLFFEKISEKKKIFLQNA